MKIVPIAELGNVEEGNIVIGMRLAGTDISTSDRFVATVNGLVCVSSGEAGMIGVFYTYDQVETTPRFQQLSYMDAGTATDWRDETPPA